MILSMPVIALINDHCRGLLQIISDTMCNHPALVQVSVNDVIQVDTLDLDPGTEITLDKVLLVGSLNYTLIGRPLLPSSTVTVSSNIQVRDIISVASLSIIKRLLWSLLTFFI